MSLNDSQRTFGYCSARFLQARCPSVHVTQSVMLNHWRTVYGIIIAVVVASATNSHNARDNKGVSKPGAAAMTCVVNSDVCGQQWLVWSAVMCVVNSDVCDQQWLVWSTVTCVVNSDVCGQQWRMVVVAVDAWSGRFKCRGCRSECSDVGTDRVCDGDGSGVVSDVSAHYWRPCTQPSYSQ